MDATPLEDAILQRMDPCCWEQLRTQTTPDVMDHQCPVCAKRWRVHAYVEAAHGGPNTVLAIHRLSP